MTMHESKGKFYGTVPVILSRVVEPNERIPFRHTVYEIGHKPPYGGVSARLDGKNVEEPVEWWESAGWTVTVDRLLAELMGWELAPSDQTV
ncbi:hypothetical protein SEA_DEJAVU_115 [Microbacterium Phage DejaVu]|nr:hypothetical protein SEA_ROMAN_115 [Microbacterium phage Roman]WNM66247.1 hypothetical protein SEA_DEJAVU_115 [Microbacterium Phage DejaVu]